MASKPKGELSVKDTIKVVKDLLKKRRHIRVNEILPGNILFTQYSAKYDQLVYDKTPLVLILRTGSSHTLGLNFHWIPYRMRLALIRIIIDLNKNNIKNNKPLNFNYKTLKGYLKKFGYAPCVRKYINKRFTLNGVVIPPEKLLSVARLNTATFTKGVKSEVMYNLAKNKKI